MADIIFVPGNITRKEQRNPKELRAITDEINKSSYEHKCDMDIGTSVEIHNLGTEKQERHLLDKTTTTYIVFRKTTNTPIELLKAMQSVGHIIRNTY